MDVIDQLAQEFLEENLDFVQSDDFIPKLKQAAEYIDAKADRIRFITGIMEGVTGWIDNHRKDCKQADCYAEGIYRKVSYFLQQELGRLGVVVDEDAFSTQERDAMHEKLEKILNELAQIKEGQGVVAQDVEDLKDLMYLGKKKWYKQYVGTVSGWVTSGVIKEATAKPLLATMNDMLGQLSALLEG